jgi:5-formyltetrahydrofolate cyclo-ligase
MDPTPLAADGLGRAALRRRLRARRRALTPRARARAARELASVLGAAPLLRGRRRLALYLPNDGEIDPRPAAARLALRGAALHLPCIDPLRGGGRLAFGEVRPGSPLLRNRFGIPEPRATRRRPPWALDVVLLPLVGFDARGGRLGMGGGFYDRTFAFLRADTARQRPGRPLLVGLAHACQEVDDLPTAAHDVPLDAVATDRGLIPITETAPWR